MAIVLKPENVAQLVFFIRGEKVMFDADLATLYGVEARSLNQAVARNRKRFPEDFMFQLTAEEYGNIRSQIVTTSAERKLNLSQSVMRSQIVISKQAGVRGASPLRSQIVTSKTGRGGRRYLPYAFTEQGVAMLSSVLRSSRAIEVNIAIMRTFVQLRRLMDTNRDLARKIEALEKKYDEQFAVVFEAIKQLIAPPAPPKKEIGFHP
jgi:ORF6N domain